MYQLENSRGWPRPTVRAGVEPSRVRRLMAVEDAARYRASPRCLRPVGAGTSLVPGPCAARRGFHPVVAVQGPVARSAMKSLPDLRRVQDLEVRAHTEQRRWTSFGQSSHPDPQPTVGIGLIEPLRRVDGRSPITLAGGQPVPGDPDLTMTVACHARRPSSNRSRMRPGRTVGPLEALIERVDVDTATPDRSGSARRPSRPGTRRRP